MIIDIVLLWVWVGLMAACVINSTILTIEELLKGLA